MAKIIGLTGGIASGKSTVSRVLRELGAEIFDADQAARKIVEPGTGPWQAIVDQFGQEILNADRTINRAKLGEIVFRDPQARARLNEITHPAVRAMARDAIARFKARGRGRKEGWEPEPVLVLDIPLLFEAGMDNLVDEVWLVYASPQIQLERLMKRNGLTREEALARLAAQMPLEEKKTLADKIIDNQGTIEETRKNVIKLWEELQNQLSTA